MNHFCKGKTTTTEIAVIKRASFIYLFVYLFFKRATLIICIFYKWIIVVLGKTHLPHVSTILTN